MRTEVPVLAGVSQLSPYRAKRWSVVWVFTPAGPQQQVDVLLRWLINEQRSKRFSTERCTQLHDNLWW